jgi:hypothetical protein
VLDTEVVVPMWIGAKAFASLDKALVEVSIALKAIVPAMDADVKALLVGNRRPDLAMTNKRRMIDWARKNMGFH